MFSQAKLDTEKTFFYVFWFDDRDHALVRSVEPISNTEAKKSGGCSYCDECRGVFFKERGESWSLLGKKVMEWASPSEVMCHGSMITEAETFHGPRTEDTNVPWNAVSRQGQA